MCMMTEYCVSVYLHLLVDASHAAYTHAHMDKYTYTQLGLECTHVTESIQSAVYMYISWGSLSRFSTYLQLLWLLDLHIEGIIMALFLVFSTFVSQVKNSHLWYCHCDTATCHTCKTTGSLFILLRTASATPPS